MPGPAIKKILFVPGPEVIMQSMILTEAWPFSCTVRPATCVILFRFGTNIFSREYKRHQAVDDYALERRIL